jgi:cyanate permease
MLAAGIFFGGVYLVWLAQYLFGWFWGLVILGGIIVWFFAGYLPNWKARKKYEAEEAERAERVRLARERQGKP